MKVIFYSKLLAVAIIFVANLEGILMGINGLRQQINHKLLPITLLFIFTTVFLNRLIGQTELYQKLETAITITNFPPPLDDPSLPFSIVTINEDTPDWAQMMYMPDPDLFLISKLYNAWRLENENTGGDHVRNYRKLKGYLGNNNLIDFDGHISIPTQNEINLHQAKILKDRSSQKERNNAKNNQNTTWQFIGVDHMKNTIGEEVNRHINIYSLSQCLSQPNILYCTSESGGTVFKTTNNGNSWFSVSDNLIADMGDRAIEVAPTDPDIVYLGTKHDIFKSTVGGNIWTSIYSVSNSSTRALLIHPTNPDIVFAGGSNGILKTIDGGGNWTNPLVGKLIHDIRYMPGSHTAIYALAENINEHYTEFYKSTDGGETWTLKPNGWPIEASTKDFGGQMTTSDGHPNIIFAFIGAMWADESNLHNIKILKSSDMGETWVTKVDYDNEKGINRGQGYYDWDIEMSDVDSNIVALGTQNSWISYDGFETITTDLRHGWSPHADIQEMLFNGNEIWVANDGGVVKFENDSLYNWTVKSTGINSISYWGYDHGWNEDVSCGVHYHNGTSATHGNYEPNVAINLGGAEPHFALVSHNGDKVVSKGYGSVDGYTMPQDQDGVFKQFNYNLTPNSDYVIGNNGAVHPAYYNTHFQPKENKIVKTENFGVTWDTVYSLPAVDDYIWDIRMTRADLNTIYISTLKSSEEGGADIYKSTDGGQNFSKITLPSWFDNDPKIISIEVSNDSVDELYIMRNRYGTKVAKSIDGGGTWTDITTSSLSGYSGQKIMLADGTDGGIYLTAGSAVFYKNNTLPEWEILSDGLPANSWTRFIKPFYKEGELRIASERGVHKAALYDTPQLSNNLVQPSVDKASTKCSRDTFYFDDFSIVNHQGASWEWSFPGASYVSDNNDRNPKVLCPQSGTYDVSMNINQNGQTYTKMIPQMVTIDDQCGVVDSLPGKAISFAGDEDYVVSDDFKLTTNTFSYTAWVKPHENLIAFSGLFSNGVWCAHCNDETLGLEIDYWGGHLWYRWPGSTSGWAGRTDLEPKVDEWNYVAMVMSPDSVVVYLNDQKWVSNISHAPATISQLYLGKGFYSKYLKGEMDEVTFWKKSLTDNEVRELMHLTKDPSEHPDLLAYYQFNEATGDILDKSKTYKGYLQGNAQRTASTAPIGGGTSQRKQESAGMVDFTETGVSINYNTANDAEVVVSKVFNAPYFMPSSMNKIYDQQYWTLHRYGDGSFLASMTFTLDEHIFQEEELDKDQYVLLGRAAHSDTTWSVIETASMINSESREITFNNVSASYSQFLIGKMNADCLSALVLSNRNDLSGINVASKAIYAGNIYDDGDVTILNGQSATLQATEHITMQKGFLVKSGGILLAKLEGCPDD